MPPCTVLYIDDEPDLLVLGKTFLESIGDFAIDTRISAPEGLSALRTRSYDVIVSDYQMPEMDGLVFLKTVREEFGDVPFILFTGRGRESVVIEAINYGVDFYLQKGGDVQSQFAELAHKIKMAVGRKRAVDEHIESEKLLSSIFHASPIHQMISEYATGRILDINDRFLADLRLSREDVIGKTMEDLGLVPDPLQYCAIVRQLGNEGMVRNAELRIRAGSGRTYTSLTSLTRVQVHDADLIYTQSMDITGQKKAQQTINALLNAPPDVSLLLDVQGTILTANNAASARYHMAAEDLIGSNVFPLISPAYADLRKAKVNEALTTGKPLVYIDNQSGRSYENHLYPVIGPAGDIDAVAVYSSDVTEERQAKEALHESEEKYRLVVEHSHDTIYIYRDNRFVFVNRQAENLTGFSHEELMQRDIWDFIHPDDRKRLKESAEKRFAGGHVSSTFYARILTKSGEDRDGEFFVDLVDFLGKPAILGIARDITEKKRAAEAIREREEQLRSLADNLPSGMVYQAIIEPGGKRRFAHVSAGVEQIHEVTAEQVLQDPSVLYNQILEKDRVAFREAEDRALASMAHFSFETRIRTPSGRQKYVLLRSAPRLLAGGSTIWDGIELDITASKRAEDELQAAYEQLAASREELQAQLDVSRVGQEHLAESEEKYRTLVEHTADGVFIAEDGNLVFSNTAFASLAGYNPEEILGKPFPHLIVPEDRDMVLRRHRARTAGNNAIIPGDTLPESYEFSLLHKDGTTRIRVSMRVGRGTYHGRPATIGTLHDVTRERHQEAVLAESEELHRKMIGAMPDIIVRSDLEGNIVFINRKGAELAASGDPAELIGKPMFSFFAPESLPAALENTKLMFERPLGPREYTFIASDGRRVLLEVNGDVLRTPEGTPHGMIFICRDISDRKRAEEALRNSETEYRNIIENMQDVFYRTNRDGIITMISPYGARLVGFDSPSDIIGKYHATDFYADPGERDAFFARLLREKNVTGYPLTLRDRQGELHYATASSHLIYDRDGNTDGVEGILHDITSIMEVKNALRQANRQITLMTNITRHDILNQLMILAGWLELSRASVDNPARTLELITREQKIAGIIRQQINFTTLFEDMGVKPSAWQDPAALIEKTRAALPFDKVRLDCDLPAIEIFADPLLEKVFYNLCDNSLRYGGERMTTIHVHAREEVSSLILIIGDDGAGVAEPDKKLLFERGFGKNTGLGLFLVKEILSITGITIRECGIPEKGARFEIMVPAGKYRFVTHDENNS